MERKETEKELLYRLTKMTANRDQQMTFIRNHLEAISVIADLHPQPLVKALALFAIAELHTCPEIDFVENKDDGDR